MTRKISIRLNGESWQVDEQTVASLIEQLKLRATRIAVEVNQQVVPKAAYAETLLREDDQVEIINFVGGG